MEHERVAPQKPTSARTGWEARGSAAPPTLRWGAPSHSRLAGAADPHPWPCPHGLHRGAHYHCQDYPGQAQLHLSLNLCGSSQFLQPRENWTLLFPVREFSYHYKFPHVWQDVRTRLLSNPHADPGSVCSRGAGRPSRTPTSPRSCSPRNSPASPAPEHTPSSALCTSHCSAGPPG